VGLCFALPLSKPIAQLLDALGQAIRQIDQRLLPD